MLYIKFFTNVSFLTPGDPRKVPLDLYFLSEIHLLDVSHSRRTNLFFFFICIAFADALPLHYLILFSFAKIPCETSRIFGGPMSTSIAFAHDLFPICLTIFSFSNILCGTCGILGGPISISIAFAHALFQLYLVLIIQLLPFRIALYT